ncbi:E3 ubiquitin-protein ligase RNF26-like [Cloeon dipterum]|uniref:E3 ubiquitin-protein ligase RNF26-like n=1 Tax=Cloeon dipterum TaxID=197152 RepID=UPI00321FD86F
MIAMTMLEGIVKGMASAGHLLKGLLFVSYKCGAVIVAAVAATGRLIAAALNSLASLVAILFEDFCFFSADVLSKAVEALQVLSYLVSGLFANLKNAVFTVKDGIASVIQSMADSVFFVYDSIGQIWGMLLSFAEFIKWILMVIGQGCWFAVQLVPLCIVYLVYSFLSLAIMILTEIAEQTQMAGTFCLNQTSSAVSWCYHFVTDFPVESLMGLVSAFILSYWLHKRRSSIGSTIVQAGRWTGYTAKTTARKMWCTVMQCLHMGQSSRTSMQRHRLDDSDDEDVPLALRLRARKSLQEVNLKRQLLVEQEEKLCVVCLERNKCVILMPCRHLCMCLDCSAVLSNTTSSCPICRTYYERAVPVYM